MSQYQVSTFNFTSSAGYVCYPKVSSNSKTWDSRTINDWTAWTLSAGGTKPVDLVNDAGFQPGDVVFASINVVGGSDASCDTMFTVTEGGSVATFEAQGSAFDTSLAYQLDN